MASTLLNIKPMKTDKPWILLVLGIFIIATSALAISSGSLDYLKTTKKGEPPPLIGNVVTLDDAINELRGIGCTIVESFVIQVKSLTPPTPLEYTAFRSYAYKNAVVLKVTTLGETTLYTYDDDNKYYSWIPSGQVELLPPKYSQLIITNTTCTKVSGGWQVTMSFKSVEENGDSLNYVTIDGLEIQYPNCSANGVILNNLSTDLVY